MWRQEVGDKNTGGNAERNYREGRVCSFTQLLNGEKQTPEVATEISHSVSGQGSGIDDEIPLSQAQKLKREQQGCKSLEGAFRDTKEGKKWVLRRIGIAVSYWESDW